MTTNRSSLSKDAALASSISSMTTTPLLQKNSAIDIGEDTDENKYKRRSALTWFARWWRNFVSPHLRSRSRGNKKQQLLMIAFLVVFGLVTLLVIFHYFGRSGGEEDYRGDPMLDPMNNPNIRIGIN